MFRLCIDEDIGDYYTLTDQILGKGFFAKVVVGIDKVTKEKVAVKIVDKSKVESNPKLIQNEVDIMAKVNHPNIIELKAIFHNKSGLYIVMELAPGGELYALVSKKKYLSESDASRLIGQVFLALEYLHKNGIVHRDLKLENMLLMNRHGLDLKITDFGLSKIYSGEALKTACGTPFYVAPEILNGRGYGPAVDMWAAGILLYVILSGRLPFHSDNNARLFRMIQECNLVFKKPQFDSVSSQARDLIKNLITQDPEKRYTATQALQHEFIVGSTSKEPLHPSLCENLRKLSKIALNDPEMPAI